MLVLLDLSAASPSPESESSEKLRSESENWTERAAARRAACCSSEPGAETRRPRPLGTEGALGGGTPCILV